MKFATQVKSVLLELIKEISSNPTDFVKHPEKDFVRNRKLDLEKTIRLILSLSNKSSQDELLDFFNHSIDTPTLSALVQQRDKLSESLFPTLLYQLNNRFPGNKLYMGVFCKPFL